MGKKRKITPDEKAERARRKAEFMTIFIRGKQKRVPRPQMIEGTSADEFTLRNADPLWLHQNGMWEYIVPEPAGDRAESIVDGADRIPF